METLGLLRLHKISRSCTVVLGVIILATCTCFVHDLWAVHSDEREQRIDQHGHLTSHVTQKTVPLQEPTETYFKWQAVWLPECCVSSPPSLNLDYPNSTHEENIEVKVQQGPHGHVCART